MFTSRFKDGVKQWSFHAWSWKGEVGRFALWTSLSDFFTKDARNQVRPEAPP